MAGTSRPAWCPREWPLAGCRSVDFGIITAGAARSGLLVDLGADIIKVESPTYADPFRAWPSGDSTALPFFRSNQPRQARDQHRREAARGRAAILRLVAKSDVVIENFRRGVLDRLGLGIDALRAANPDIILLSISSQGDSGPDAAYVSYGSTLEAMGGLAWVTGYAGEEPCISGRELNYPDQVVALFAAGVVLAAWLARQRGEGGAVLDVCQRELTSFMLGEACLAAAEVTGAPRSGNAVPTALLQDCFRAADGRWVAVTVDPAQRDALCATLGYADIGPAALGAWIGAAPAAQRVAALRARGIAASSVCNGGDIALNAATAGGSALRLDANGAVLKGMPFTSTSPVPSCEVIGTTAVVRRISCVGWLAWKAVRRGSNQRSVNVIEQ
jgi:crotonobetainyl-CoA:carnitine CoA-transferase CaiB-like acyl-CoA transferase